MIAMMWKRLLSTRRVRELLEGAKPSARVAGDVRDEFDRDFDRIIYSTPFRRLQDKTQVFPLDPNDSVRTRLTHSLEVSSAARGLAKGACRWLLGAGHITAEQAKSIETIAGACGMLHDLGNPPFGHSGEEAIREWFRNSAASRQTGVGGQFCADFRHFEGNAQTLRLVARLQVLADFFGLNLTAGTLSAARKYVAPSHLLDNGVHERSKAGHFASENDLVARVQKETGTGEGRNPIAFLVEAADDCVYNVVDLEDAMTKDLFDWGELKERLLNEGRRARVVRGCLDWAEARVKRSRPALRGRARDKALVQYFRVRTIGEMVTAAVRTFCAKYARIMSSDYHGELLVDSPAAPLLRACRRINAQSVYCSRGTLELELMGRRIIQDILAVFWEAVDRGRVSSPPLFAKKAYDLLSDNYRRVFERQLAKGDLPLWYCKRQLVTDYVCGMTDTYAVELHKRLMNG